jgi:alkylhydroperoxidase family enzyme
MQTFDQAEVEANPPVKAVFDDIRATRESDFVNNFWRGLANDPALLKRIGEGLKAVMMAEGALEPLVRGMTYIAVSTANGCAYWPPMERRDVRSKRECGGHHSQWIEAHAELIRSAVTARSDITPADCGSG